MSEKISYYCQVCGVAVLKNGRFQFSYDREFRPQNSVSADEVYSKVCRRLPSEKTKDCVMMCKNKKVSYDPYLDYSENPSNPGGKISKPSAEHLKWAKEILENLDITP